ncbi:MAG: DUF6438 domain-containing protein [Ferruginibacter sp.]
MKHLVSIALIFVTNFALANKIDFIKTDKDVLKFFTELYKKEYADDSYVFLIGKPDPTYRDFICDSVSLTWNVKEWQKVDFDEDNCTDLFIRVFFRNRVNDGGQFEIFTVMGNNNNTYSLQPLPEYFMPHCKIATPINISGKSLLLYRHYKTEYTIDSLSNNDTTLFQGNSINYYEVGRTDTLIYLFGGFVELNTKKFSPPVKSFFFQTSLCFGDCPQFQLKVSRDGSANYNAGMYSGKEGYFETTIKPQHLDQTLSLIHYLNIPDLKSNYECLVTDLPSCTLKVYFEDGTIKELYDYGQQGTLGLVRLYKILFALRENQEWK